MHGKGGKILVCIFSFSLLFPLGIHSQPITFSIRKAGCSTNKFNEFSPVYYKGKLIYCTDNDEGMKSYSSFQKIGLSNIYMADTTKETGIGEPFAKELNTLLNDGPVTFNSRGDTIYFTRNLLIDKKTSELSSKRNKLGIFSAVLEDGKWTRIREFRYNNEWYNLISPCLSPDGKRLYFASDNPEGFGGMDLYYSVWEDGYWGNPVNLGPKINTKGSETYPFITSNEDLLFSSDGHHGLGGKDIFITRPVDTSWIKPIALNPPINSPADDFGIVSDPLIDEGYFSSNRTGTMDLFYFKAKVPQFFFVSPQRENQFCFQFSEKLGLPLDNTKFLYTWNFGDKSMGNGYVINHCFPGPGMYNITFDIIDRKSGKLFFNIKQILLELNKFKQPYITSPEKAIEGSSITFNGNQSWLPDFNIISYLWDFGDGTYSSGIVTNHIFLKEGTYIVKLGITTKQDSEMTLERICVSKPITIISGSTAMREGFPLNIESRDSFPNINNCEYAHIVQVNSPLSDSNSVSVFSLVIKKSQERLGINNFIFNNLPKKYRLKESHNPINKMYYYKVDQQMDLYACHPSFLELQSMGFRDVYVDQSEVEDPAEKELVLLQKTFSNSTDDNFDIQGRLVPNVYVMLDQVLKILLKYPGLQIEIGVHSDNTLSSINSVTQTLKYGNSLRQYLINRGIEGERVISTGYGDTKPIASNSTFLGRKMNRRIELRAI